LAGANLRGAILDGAILHGADLTGADLNNANLNKANLDGANLTEADLSNSLLTGANLENANLSGATVQYADFTEASLYKASLHGANLSHSSFTVADMREVDLSSASLFGARLVGANLRNADLGNALLYQADMRNARMESADLNGANLTGTNLRGADLTYADLTGAIVDNTDLYNSNLTNANFTNATMRDVNIENAIIQNTIFDGTLLAESSRDNKNGDLLKEAVTRAVFDPKDAEHFDTKMVKAQGVMIHDDWINPHQSTVLKGDLAYDSSQSSSYAVELKEGVEKQVAESASFEKDSMSNPRDSFIAARSYADAWQESANKSAGSEMIQESASRVLLGQEATLPSGWEDKYQGQSTQSELVVFEMYQRTQKELIDSGYEPEDTIKLYRGVKGDTGAEEFALRPLSSWSASPDTAAQFATFSGTVWTAEVPIANIVSTPVTGFGCYDEQEVVVLSVPQNSKGE
jgi:uncharacterized protein YjbI with pentapeptide repeats